MKKEEITAKHVLAICKLYQQYLGGYGIRYYIENRFGYLDDLVEEIREHGKTEDYRIGSRYNSETKFCFINECQTKDVFPYVNLNFHPKSRHGSLFMEAQKAIDMFMEKSIKYLS